MAFGLTPDGFKIKRLADIKEEIEASFRAAFGDEIDLSAATPEGQIIGIMAERESLVWELAQDVYDSQYPTTSEGKSLDSVAALTGTVRTPAQKSQVITGVARGTNGTIVLDGTIISVVGDPTARFVVQGNHEINIVDGATFKSALITLIAEETGPIQANAGTLTEIETPIGGMDSFTNEEDAILGSNIEEDSELKLKRNQELQIAGSSTIDAIISEIGARELVDAVIVFQNITSITDVDGRPPHSLDIVVSGDDEQDLADAIFAVVGGGIETIGDITKTALDSEGFSHTIKFSRPSDVDIWQEYDLTVDSNLYPLDGDDQVEQAILDYGERKQTIGVDVVVYGSDPLVCAFSEIPGITDVVVRVGEAEFPTEPDNIIIEPREIAKFDSSRIAIVSA